MTARRVRLDAALVRHGLAPSRAVAQQLIAEGRVTVAGTPASKASTLVALDTPLLVVEQTPGHAPRWASRGALKLAGALEAFDVVVRDRVCLDAGASTGGFTDVLLRRGAARVVAVDVGYGQLDWRLRSDPRVVVLDRTNVRYLTRADVPGPPAQLVVADLSFISLTLVLPALRAVADPQPDFVLLVKPQFEAGPERVGKGGVVRDARVWADALEHVVAAARVEGLALVGATASPLPGPAGNVEFFVHLREGGLDVRGADEGAGEGDAGAHIAAAVEEGLRVRAGQQRHVPPVQ